MEISYNMSYTKEKELMDEGNISDKEFQENIYLSMIILKSI